MLFLSVIDPPALRLSNSFPSVDALIGVIGGFTATDDASHSHPPALAIALYVPVENLRQQFPNMGQVTSHMPLSFTE